MKVCVWPRDTNPYQGELGAALGDLGVSATFCGEPTSRHSLNLLLLPFSLVVRRARGYRVVHLHWLYRFCFPLVGDHQLVRRLARSWLGVVLTVIRLCRLRLVWTAHNLLPHQQIFDDDEAARRRLLGACDGLIVHSAATLDAIRAHGWPLPPVTAVIAPAPFTQPYVPQSRARELLGLDPDRFTIGLVGRIDRYKGVLDLLDAVAELAKTGDAPAVVVAGLCGDQALRSEIEARAAALEVPVRLDLRELSDSEFATRLAAQDVFVVPFQRVTTSGSVATALAAGLRVLVPAEAALGDIPEDLLRRYDRLPAALRELRQDRSQALHRQRASDWAQRRTWHQVAVETAALYEDLVRGGTRQPDRPDQRAPHSSSARAVDGPRPVEAP